jgi:hypothetical protein
MELKTARLTLLIDPAKKAAFEQLCARQDVTPSQVVRRLIRAYLAEHGVDYLPSGSAEAEADAAVASPPAPTAARASRQAKAAAAPAGARRRRK